MTPEQLDLKLTILEIKLTQIVDELHKIREMKNLQQHVDSNSPLVTILEQAQIDQE